MTIFLTDDRGAAAVEYAIIAAVMGLALFTIMPQLTSRIAAQFSALGSHIASGN